MSLHFVQQQLIGMAVSLRRLDCTAWNDSEVSARMSDQTAVERTLTARAKEPCLIYVCLSPANRRQNTVVRIGRKADVHSVSAHSFRSRCTPAPTRFRFICLIIFPVQRRGYWWQRAFENSNRQQRIEFGTEREARWEEIRGVEP